MSFDINYMFSLADKLYRLDQSDVPNYKEKEWIAKLIVEHCCLMRIDYLKPLNAYQWTIIRGYLRHLEEVYGYLRPPQDSQTSATDADPMKIQFQGNALTQELSNRKYSR